MALDFVKFSWEEDLSISGGWRNGTHNNKLISCVEVTWYLDTSPREKMMEDLFQRCCTNHPHLLPRKRS